MEYDFSKSCSEETTHYYVAVKESQLKGEVSEEVYKELRRLEWREQKPKYFCNLENLLSLDYEYDNGNYVTTFAEFCKDSNSPQPESIYLQKERHSEIWSILRQNCSDAEIELLIAIVINERTEQDYANELKVPRSTIHSRKTALLKKLKKFFEKF